MILIVCLLGMGVGLLTGGRLRSIWHKRFRLVPALFLSLACELFLSSSGIHDWLSDSAFYLSIRVSAVVLQYAFILLFLWVNRFKPGLWLVMSGSLLNALVMIANEGRMPIGQAILDFWRGGCCPNRSGASLLPCLRNGALAVSWGYHSVLALYDQHWRHHDQRRCLFFLGIYLPKVITRQKNDFLILRLQKRMRCTEMHLYF